MATHNKKNPRSFLWYTPFLARKAAPFLLYCAFLLNAKKVEKYWECKKKNLLKNSQKTFFSANKKIVPPLHPCYGSQKHHLPWRHLYPCTHRKKIIPPPLWKKPCPCVIAEQQQNYFPDCPFWSSDLPSAARHYSCRPDPRADEDVRQHFGRWW